MISYKKTLCVDFPVVDITATLNGQQKHVLEGGNLPGQVLNLAKKSTDFREQELGVEKYARPKDWRNIAITLDPVTRVCVKSFVLDSYLRTR